MTQSPAAAVASGGLATAEHIEITGLPWPEVRDGDDLAELLLASVAPSGLTDGDIVAITSKVVSKAEGRRIEGDRLAAVTKETVRIVARRGDSVIAETRHGLVMAAAGVDASNTEPGTALLLPSDPDASARRLREAILDRVARNIGVLITDTAGRAWRNGQIDIAVGCAGVAPITDLSGTTDPYGNVLMVTAAARADEIASAADLVKGKTSARPAAIVRGLHTLVLPPGEHGLGARELVRPSDLDLFGLGAREAAVAAGLRTDPIALAHFPPTMPVDAPPFDDVISEDPHVRVTVTPTARPATWTAVIELHEAASPRAWLHAGRLWERCLVLAAAHRLVVDTDQAAPPSPTPGHGWRAVVRIRAGVA